MARVKIAKIWFCTACPHCGIVTGAHVCLAGNGAPKALDVERDIPDWCPLPDAPESNERCTCPTREPIGVVTEQRCLWCGKKHYV